MGQQVFEEEVGVHSRQLVRRDCGVRELRGEAGCGCRVARIHEALLHGDATLLQEVEDASGIGKRRRAPDLGGKRRQGLDVLGESACANDQQGICEERVIVICQDVVEEAEVTEPLLHEGVELFRSVRCRVQRAQKLAEQPCVGQVVSREATQVEVVVHVVDVVRGKVVVQTG